ncbi:hypothetical protein SpCBS45565_g05710 [Spizellomyces sp. 'palustris']|nr:hypothetical protein SpCBS45565_g05710 [Spizellomyces sp. 'palustris']
MTTQPEDTKEHLEPVVGSGEKDGFEPSPVYGDYVALPTGLPDEGTALTVRAIIIGIILGSVVAASNIYLGLKTGFTFGASLFGAIFGFAILKPLSVFLPKAFGGGYFGPKENCTIQTAATAAGGLGTIFVAAVPAMYRLGLLSKDPKDDIGKIIALTFITAYYGLFFAVPLRKYFIIKQKLVFPTPFASANTIASLHAVGGEAEGVYKAKIMAGSMLFAILWNVFGYFLPGIRSWHVFTWFHQAGCAKCFEVEQWSWYIEWTPAFIGAGMLSGLHVSCSMWLGSFLAWGVIGPVLFHTGKAIEPFLSLSKLADPANHPTPRYWLLWPGIMLMICASFAELFYNWRSIYNGLKGGVTEFIANIRGTRGNSADLSLTNVEDEDPAPRHEQVPALVWCGGLLLSSIVTITVLATVFKVNVGEGILSIILAFIFGFIGIQASGQTDINPIGAIAKTSQFVFGGISRGKGMTGPDTLPQAQLNNLLAGAVAGSAASQAVDMVGDLKTGHLLRASPRTQFIAQIFGTFAAVFIGVGLFILYSSAYPCINDPTIEKCSFNLPSVTAWEKTAVALTSPKPSIPTSSGITAIVMGIVAVFSVILRHKLPAKYAWMVPNFSAIGISWVLQTTVYSTAMVIGALVMTVWQKRNPASWMVWGFALSSGFIAGEGLGGLINAIFQMSGLDGEKVGFAIGCPLDEFNGTPAYCG